MKHLVRGYHGTSEERASQLVAEGFDFSRLQSRADLVDGPGPDELWFGYGWYFHEENPGRAQRWAVLHYGEESAAVVEAQIDLSDSDGLDLTQQKDRERLAAYAKLYQQVFESDASAELPVWMDGKAIDLAVSEGVPWVRVLAFTEASSYLPRAANANLEARRPSTLDYGFAAGNKDWTSRVIRDVSIQVVVFVPDVVSERRQVWPTRKD